MVSLGKNRHSFKELSGRGRIWWKGHRFWSPLAGGSDYFSATYQYLGLRVLSFPIFKMEKSFQFGKVLRIRIASIGPDSSCA